MVPEILLNSVRRILEPDDRRVELASPPPEPSAEFVPPSERFLPLAPAANNDGNANQDGAADQMPKPASLPALIAEGDWTKVWSALEYAQDLVDDQLLAEVPPERLQRLGDELTRLGRSDLAEASFSAALMLTPRESDVWAARARARAMEGEWKNAESDLDAAITFNKTSPEYYVLRSAAHAALGNDDLAVRDIDAALDIDPNFPAALAERRLMPFASGNEDGAREDWIIVLNAAPESAAADVARSGIERMEIHLEP